MTHGYIPFINKGNNDMKKKIIYILSAIILLNSAYTYAGPQYSYSDKPIYVNKLPDVAALVLISGISYWVADNIYYKKQNGRYFVTPSPVKKHKLPTKSVVVYKNGKHPQKKTTNVYQNNKVQKKSVVVYKNAKQSPKKTKNVYRKNTSNKQQVIIKR